jgi:transposase
MAAHLMRHPDADIVASLPGLGPILGSRVLGEFGDDPDRFSDAAARRAYATTAPVTRASGKRRVVVRRGGNRRLADACRLWAFATLTASPGARAHYDRRRAAGDGHEAALRNLANKLVGQLHYCLHHHIAYLEHLAWPAAPAPPTPSAPASDTRGGQIDPVDPAAAA